MKTYTIDTENNITLHTSAQEAEAITNCEVFSTPSDFAALAEKWPLSRLVEIWNSLPGASTVKKFTDRKSAVTRIWKAIQSLGEVAGAPESPTTASIAVEPVAQPQEPEVALDGMEPPATNELVIPESEPQADPEPLTEIGDTETSTEATEPVAEPATPFDEPVASVRAQAPDVASETKVSPKKATRAKKAPLAATGEPTLPREGSKTSQLIEMLKREGGATLDEIVTAMGWQKHTARAMMSAGGSLAKKHGLVIISEKVGDQRTYSTRG